MNQLLLRRRMAMKGVTPSTPVFIDYITTDGTAYIDTGIKANSPISVKFKVTPILEVSTKQYLGAQVSSSNRMRVLQWGSSISGSYKNYFAYIYNSSALQGLNMSQYINGTNDFSFECSFKKNTQTFRVKKGNDSWTGLGNGTNSTDLTTNLNIFLFANNLNGTADGKTSSGTKGHYYKIYSDATFTTLVFDGVPCYCNGEYGLWDNVTNQFFGNVAGSGAFTGPSIT